MRIITITSHLLILSDVDVFKNFKSLLYNPSDMYSISEMDLRLYRIRVTYLGLQCHFERFSFIKRHYFF